MTLQKKAREGAVDSVRGKEIAVELKKSPSEGNQPYRIVHLEIRIIH